MLSNFTNGLGQQSFEVNIKMQKGNEIKLSNALFDNIVWLAFLDVSYARNGSTPSTLT